MVFVKIAETTADNSVDVLTVSHKQTKKIKNYQYKISTPKKIIYIGITKEN